MSALQGTDATALVNILADDEDRMSRRLYVEKGAGVYLTKIDGVNVRIVRRKAGRHPVEHTWSNQPNWTAKLADEVAARALDLPNGRTLSDGQGTRDGAADGAERFIRDRRRAR